MKASPLTLLNLQFMRVHVEANFAREAPAADYSFEGAMLAWSINHGQESDGRWWVAMGFATDQGDASGNPCPYHVDVQAVGFFTVSEQIAASEHEALVYENGGALVFGAIRDMVATITARSMPGQLMLPTPSFVGTFNERQH